MSADVLRGAATKLREAVREYLIAFNHDSSLMGTFHAEEILRAVGFSDHRVATQVADWLDAEAEEIPPGATHYRDGLIEDSPAVRVARSIAGGGES